MTSFCHIILYEVHLGTGENRTHSFNSSTIRSKLNYPEKTSICRRSPAKFYRVKYTSPLVRTELAALAVIDTCSNSNAIKIAVMTVSKCIIDNRQYSEQQKKTRNNLFFIIVRNRFIKYISQIIFELIKDSNRNEN